MAKRDAIKDALREMTAAVEGWLADGTLGAGSPPATRALELTSSARKLLSPTPARRKKYDPATDGPPRWSAEARPDDTAATQAEFAEQAEAYRVYLTEAGLRDPVTGGNTRAHTVP